jgi:inner membrane protein
MFLPPFLNIMASLLTHAVAAVALGQAAKPALKKDWRFWTASVGCSILPDVDVIGFRFGIHYGDLWGHRGISHSLLFAALIAIVVGSILKYSGNDRWGLMLLLFVITASHGFLDAMTDGGLGVAFFSPFNTTRYFLPWRPIHVSPISISRFFAARGLGVLLSEIRYVWLPCILLGASLHFLRRQEKPNAIEN